MDSTGVDGVLRPFLKIDVRTDCEASINSGQPRRIAGKAHEAVCITSPRHAPGGRTANRITWSNAVLALVIASTAVHNKR